MTHDRSQTSIDTLRQRQLEAANRVRRQLNELEAAELDFERATRKLQEAIQNDTEAA